VSALNPLWYAGAFGIGLLAGRVSDAVSLGFIVETERQVEEHLAGHLDALPAADIRSKAIVRVMKDDEARHAANAELAGAVDLPSPVKWVMRAAAKVMTSTAYYV
jgi:ubiquinone biosynthesis monooxygenase Coq7